jgi:hypothetical protein
VCCLARTPITNSEPVALSPYNKTEYRRASLVERPSSKYQSCAIQIIQVKNKFLSEAPKFFRFLMIPTSSSRYLLYHSPPMAYLNKPGNNGPPVFPHIFADVYHLSALMLNPLGVTHSVQAYTREHHRQERELKAIRTLRSFGKVQIPVYRSVIWYSIVVRRPIWRILNPRR